jgi:HSP20 family protein
VTKDEDYARKEFSYNKFDRKFQLPTTINLDKKAKATFKDGILHLQLMKKEAAKIPPKKLIEIA